MSSEKTRALQKIELEILIEIDRICKKNNLKYYMVAGTLLGAIRHKGFIPWDDDIDICMPLNDYNKFCKIAKKELNSDYFLQNYKTDFTGMWFSKIRKNGTTAIEMNHDAKLHHQGIWVDIFPMIGIKQDANWIKNTKKKALFAKSIINKKIGLLEDANKKFLIKIINSVIPINICRAVVNLFYNHIFKDPHGFDFCYYLWASASIKARFKSEWFSETCEVEFEGHKFPAPLHWNEYLTSEYGDYMTPPPPEKRNGGSHTIAIVDVDNDYTKYIKK